MGIGQSLVLINEFDLSRDATSFDAGRTSAVKESHGLEDTEMDQDYLGLGGNTWSMNLRWEADRAGAVLDSRPDAAWLTRVYGIDAGAAVRNYPQVRMPDKTTSTPIGDQVMTSMGGTSNGAPRYGTHLFRHPVPDPAAEYDPSVRKAVYAPGTHNLYSNQRADLGAARTNAVVRLAGHFTTLTESVDGLTSATLTLMHSNTGSVWAVVDTGLTLTLATTTAAAVGYKETAEVTVATLRRYVGVRLVVAGSGTSRLTAGIGSAFLLGV